MLQWDRLDRIPYTYNVKRDKETGELQTRFTRIVHPEKIRVEDFEWSLFESLEPSNIEIVRVELPNIEVKRIRKRKRSLQRMITLPGNIEGLTNHSAVPPCIRNLIDTMVKTGGLDHYQRVALVLYLKWMGYDKEKVIEFFAKSPRTTRRELHATKWSTSTD